MPYLARWRSKNAAISSNASFVSGAPSFRPYCACDAAIATLHMPLEIIA